MSAPPPQAAGPSATAGLSDADEISKLLNALGTRQEPVDFVIPAGPGGATRPLGAVLSAPEEKSVPDMDFILPDLRPDPGSESKEPPIVKLAPSAGTVRLSPAANPVRSESGGAVRLGGGSSTAGKTANQGAVRLGGGPSNAATKTASQGAVRLGGGPSNAAKTASQGAVHLTGDQTAAAKTAKHGTVRLTGNQTEAAKTEKHGTVRLTGNQGDVAKSEAKAPSSTAQPILESAGDEKTAIPEGKVKARRKKAPKRKPSGERKNDSLASIVFLLLVILVIMLYVGFFMIRPKILAARAAAQPAPAPSSEPAKPAVRKPASKIAPAAKTRPSRQPVPGAETPKAAASGSEQPGTAAGTGKTPPSVDVAAKTPQSGIAPEEGVDEVDVPEDDGPATPSSPEPASDPPKSVSKFAPPWARKDVPAQPVEEKPKEEVVIDVPSAVDVPEVREWPELKVTAVIGSGKRGSVLVNGNVVSVGEELEEGPVLKSVSRQAAVFEWDGDRRTIYVSAKNE